MSRHPQTGDRWAPEQGVEVLLKLAQDSDAVRNAIVNHEVVQRCLLQISEQLHDMARWDMPAPPSTLTAAPPGLWQHDPAGAPGTEAHAQSRRRRPAPPAAEPGAAAPPRPRCPPDQLFALEAPAACAGECRPRPCPGPPAAGQSDALLLHLVGKAREQLGAHEPSRAGGARDEQAHPPAGDADALVEERCPHRPRRHRSRCKEGKGRAEEPPRAGGTAWIARGVRSTCQRGDAQAMLEASGFANIIGALDMPINFKNHRNRGYFRIIFKSAGDAEQFSRLCAGHVECCSCGHGAGCLQAEFEGGGSSRPPPRAPTFCDVGSQASRTKEDDRPGIYQRGPSAQGCPLIKEIAEQALSPASPGSRGARSSPGSVSTEFIS